MKEIKNNMERAWIEINLDNLDHNVKVLQNAMPQKCKLMAVVKAKAYGHGLSLISAHLNKIGVDAFAVATIDEGICLRQNGIRGEILILGYTSVCRALELKKYDLMQTLIDFDYANALNEQGIAVKAHIKIDTGMHRLGIDSRDFSKVKSIFDLKNIEICGIYTHLCCAESRKAEDITFTKEQIEKFYKVVNALEECDIAVPKIHIQSSYAFLNYPELMCDYVRVGIALYGVLSSGNDKTVRRLELRPVLSLKTRVILIRSVQEGDSIGYDRKFKAEKECLMAVLPIGYGDGFPRNLSCGKGAAYINGQYASIVGQICMDHLMVDITEIGNVRIGDKVTLISPKKDNELSAPIISDHAGSISNELLCRLGERLPIITKSKKQDISEIGELWKLLKRAKLCRPRYAKICQDMPRNERKKRT